MKIAGIILIVLQVIGTTASLIGGKNPFSGGFLQTLGYFAIGIIGIVLLIVALTRKRKQVAGSVSETTNQNEYKMDKTSEAEYTKMFGQPFDQVVSEEKFVINNLDCKLYRFSPLYLMNCSIGGFCYMIEVNTKPKRYFASEYSYDNKFFLCEWKFDGTKEVAHLNYGESVSSINDLVNHAENVKKKLEEIL